MTHGGGGRAMAQLIDELFVREFDNEWLRQGNDQAAFDVGAGRMVMATDSHVVSPLFFPGGDIGCLSVHGTINDVAMSGATPLYLAAGFVLEEGFPLADLKRIVASMAAASREARVPVVTGDTKVVERGKGDGVFITTTGVGVVPGRHPHLRGSRPARRPDPRQRNDRRPRRRDHVAAGEPDVRDDHRVGHRGAARARRGDDRSGARHSLPSRPDARGPRAGRLGVCRHGSPPFAIYREPLGVRVRNPAQKCRVYISPLFRRPYELGRLSLFFFP